MTAKEIVYYTFKYGPLGPSEISKLRRKYTLLSDKSKEAMGWNTLDKYINSHIKPIPYGMIVCGALCAICFLASIGSVFLVSACGWGGAVGYTALLFVVLYIASIYFYQRFYWYEMPKYNIEYR